MENTNNNFEWNPADYAEHSSAQFLWGKGLLELLNLKGNESLLDIGCGDGKITELISHKLLEGKVIGIDSSKDMIRFAKQKYTSESFYNLSFILKNACELNFENEFDVVYSNAALHWIKDQELVLKGAYKSLKNKGRILFQMGGKGNLEEMIEIINATINSKKWKEYFKNFEFPYYFFSNKQYSELLINSRFKIDKVELIPRIMTHENVNGLAGWIRTTWHPYLNRLQNNFRTDFINDIINNYLKKYPSDSNGKTNVKMIRLQVQAHKE